MKQCIKYCLIIIFGSPIARQCNRSCRYFVRSCHPTSRMLYAVTSSYHPTSSPEVLRLVFTKLPLHRTCGPYASTNQQKRTPAHVHLQDAAACLCTGMRPFVESVSSSRTRRELLRVRAKKDYHLEGLQAQTLAPDSPDNNSEVLSSGAMYLLLYI